ncbi:hypothetical protein DKX38_026874 [Salix brachista]|uniref:Uncharacterized protein n=1 Tax=Salix brachista TaxID=2182728 RepID=A0A5N5JCF9_9ROSI|nr:hypothetical protein DKX38_026874 [Salix brachista]
MVLVFGRWFAVLAIGLDFRCSSGAPLLVGACFSCDLSGASSPPQGLLVVVLLPVPFLEMVCQAASLAACPNLSAGVFSCEATALVLMLAALAGAAGLLLCAGLSSFDFDFSRGSLQGVVCCAVFSLLPPLVKWFWQLSVEKMLSPGPSMVSSGAAAFSLASRMGCVEELSCFGWLCWLSLRCMLDSVWGLGSWFMQIYGCRRVQLSFLLCWLVLRVALLSLPAVWGSRRWRLQVALFKACMSRFVGRLYCSSIFGSLLSWGSGKMAAAGGSLMAYMRLACLGLWGEFNVALFSVLCYLGEVGSCGCSPLLFFFSLRSSVPYLFPSPCLPLSSSCPKFSSRFQSVSSFSLKSCLLLTSYLSLLLPWLKGKLRKNPHLPPPIPLSPVSLSSSEVVILGLPSPTKKNSCHSSLPPSARYVALEFPSLARTVPAPTKTAPPPISILGKAPIAPVSAEHSSSHHSSADYSSVEDTEEDESSGSEITSCSGVASYLEPVTVPPPMTNLGSAQFPFKGLSSPPSARISVDAPISPTSPTLEASVGLVAVTDVGMTAGVLDDLRSESVMGLTVGAAGGTTEASDGSRSESIVGLTVGVVGGLFVAANLLVPPSGAAVQPKHIANLKLLSA